MYKHAKSRAQENEGWVYVCMYVLEKNNDDDDDDIYLEHDGRSW